MKKCKHLWKLGRKSVYPQLDFEKTARFPKMEMRGEQARMCHDGARETLRNVAQRRADEEIKIQ